MRVFETLAYGRYALTKYGKHWRRVTIAKWGDPVGPVESVPVDCVAAAPVAGPVVGRIEPLKAPALVLDAAPVVAGRPCRMDAKTAALLAGAGQLQADDPEPEPERMTQQRWRKMSPDVRRLYVRQHCPDLEDEQDLADWTAELPAK